MRSLLNVNRKNGRGLFCAHKIGEKSGGGLHCAREAKLICSSELGAQKSRRTAKGE
jgi:hypothetical protein